MAAPGFTLIKEFTYRGDAHEEWGNTYHVHDTPADPATWRTIVDALIALEREVYTDVVTILRAICYEDTEADSVYTYHLADFAGTVPGALVVGDGGHTMSGDDALWVGWDTGKRNSKSKPIWLRKYFHDAHVAASQIDQTDPDQLAALGTFATAAVTPAGDWPGLTDPEGDAPTGGSRTSSFVTTRTLKRRGRRPHLT